MSVGVLVGVGGTGVKVCVGVGPVGVLVGGPGVGVTVGVGSIGVLVGVRVGVGVSRPSVMQSLTTHVWLNGSSGK